MKKMKKMKIFTLITLSVLLFAQCDDNFDELNTDPNAAISVDPSTLLTSAQYNFYNALQDSTINADWGLLMVQQSLRLNILKIADIIKISHFLTTHGLQCMRMY